MNRNKRSEAPSTTIESSTSSSIVPPETGDFTHVIEPKSGWRAIDLGEIWEYRDLLYFLVWRDVKVRYAQSVLGIGWAVIQPVFYMVVFTVVFGRLVKVESDGAPYAVFSYVALVPWTYFANAVGESTGSLVANANMLSKVYFPRVIMPLSTVLAKLVDFAIAMTVLLGLLVWYRIVPTQWVVILPLLVFLAMLISAGLGLWLAALAVQYRDIRYGIAFAIQGMMYLCPVVYPVSLIPEQFRLIYAINPMTGVIEGFRSALLGTTPMPWDLIGIGAVAALVVFVSGSFYFRRMERIFADVV